MVAVFKEFAIQCAESFDGGSGGLTVLIDAGFEGLATGHEGAAGGIANRAGRVGAGETHPQFGKAIQIGGFGLRVAIKDGNVVVEIIHCDEQNIGLSRLSCHVGEQGEGGEDVE